MEKRHLDSPGRARIVTRPGRVSLRWRSGDQHGPNEWHVTQRLGQRANVAAGYQPKGIGQRGSDLHGY